MSDKKTKIDPLLGDDGQNATPGQAAKPVKSEAKPARIAPKVPLPQIKADALAKFPGDVIAQTKYILDNSPHVDFIIPLAEGEQDGASDSVQINGYKLTVKKGTLVNIPIQVAKNLAEKYRIQMTAGEEKRIDRASDVSEALS